MKVEPGDALIVVDVQNDFCPGGALGVAGGDEIVPVINALTPKFGHRAFTRDWHPADHCSFDEAPKFVDGSWPVHCVQDTPGAEFRGDLDIPADAIIASKATARDKEVYSIFGESFLSEELEQRGVRRLFVCGLATDYCVKATALDGLKCGFEVVVIEDACRGVDVPPGSAAEAMKTMRDAGVTVIRSEEIE